MVSMDKFTTGKWNIGVNHEYLFSSLVRMNNSILHNLNIEDTSSSVDFKVPNTNIYIEMEYRQIPSYHYNTNVFDKQLILEFAQTVIRSMHIHLFRIWSW